MLRESVSYGTEAVTIPQGSGSNYKFVSLPFSPKAVIATAHGGDQMYSRVTVTLTSNGFNVYVFANSLVSQDVTRTVYYAAYK